ncbi:GAF domain-containing sensor histidine kinase [Desulfovibrio ferrophilus]|uniref:Histidine kinase/HSP90-like ATPase domain-containing protein n=1 Tax=Desulfovibrio ferrophilus TaxID=241368 RepID=A0A2Z6B1G4_9BACT|nr:GAF domain-containing sensor histidine kinase [Desulfovibrio ferrophilus]BBD09367.1 uncharacterized protein DFE_2641 [Desulfovibrio ferrophilus]
MVQSTPDQDKPREQLLFELAELRQQLKLMARFQPDQGPSGVADLRHLEKINLIEEAIRKGRGLDAVMSRVVDAIRQAFDADQAWLMYPCTPDSPSFRVPYRSCHPDFPITFPADADLPATENIVDNNRLALERDEPLILHPDHGNNVPQEAREHASAKSAMLISLHPDVGDPWLLGLHHCSFEREWSPQEQHLLRDISGRVTDALSCMLLNSDLDESRQRLKRLSAELFREQDEQRKRFASEIHDDLGQPLLAIKVGLDNALYDLGENGDHSLRKWLISAAGLAKSLVDRIRMMQEALYPSTLQDFGLLVALDAFLSDFKKIYPTITVNKVISLQNENIPDALAGVLLRIVQEGLYNAAKHSRGDSVSVALDRRDGHLRLAIRDNGQGFDTLTIGPTPGVPGGLGLPSMQERAEMTGGVFSIHSAPDKGTFIQILWEMDT